MVVAGDRQHGLNVLVDRKSRLTHISFLENKTAAATKKVMLRRLKAYPTIANASSIKEPAASGTGGTGGTPQTGAGVAAAANVAILMVFISCPCFFRVM